MRCVRGPRRARGRTAIAVGIGLRDSWRRAVRRQDGKEIGDINHTRVVEVGRANRVLQLAAAGNLRETMLGSVEQLHAHRPAPAPVRPS